MSKVFQNMYDEYMTTKNLNLETYDNDLSDYYKNLLGNLENPISLQTVKNFSYQISNILSVIKINKKSEIRCFKVLLNIYRYLDDTLVFNKIFENIKHQMNHNDQSFYQNISKIYKINADNDFLNHFRFTTNISSDVQILLHYFIAISYLRTDISNDFKMIKNLLCTINSSNDIIVKIKNSLNDIKPKIDDTFRGEILRLIYLLDISYEYTPLEHHETFDNHDDDDNPLNLRQNQIFAGISAPTISTVDPNIKVRSKSEALILQNLRAANINFEYEKPLYAESRKYIPDFTITYNHKTFYWEHIGYNLSDNPTYYENWLKKEAWYKRNFPSLLITTTESPQLVTDIIQNIKKIKEM